MNRYYSIPIPSRYLPRKIPNWIQNLRVSVSLSMRLCTLQIGIHFLKDPGFRALVSRPRSFRWPMLCWRDIYMIRYDPIDCVKPAVATEPGKVYISIQKRQFFSIILVFSIILDILDYYIRLVLVSDPGSASPFFLLAPVLHFVSVDRGERGLGGKRIVPWEKQGGQPASNIQHGFWQCNGVGPSCRSEWIILSTEANLCLLGKRIASSKFCFGRTCISITMKLIFL